MRYFLKIVATFLAFVAMLLAIAYLLPASYTVEETTEIAVHPDTCINRLHNAQTWNLWRKADGPDSIAFEPDKPMIPKGLSGVFTRNLNIKQVSIDTVWVDECPAGSVIRWRSEVRCDFPIGRITGLFNRGTIGKQVKEQLDIFQRYLDESTLGPPVKIDQEEAVCDR
jgi:hypothetical protein